MGVKKIKRRKPKPRPKPVIEYPPVPTKKWIPPEKRKKPPKPEPRYVKPEGISQKLAISTLKKVWNKFEVYGDAAIITGSFSQYHRRFTFKSNGYQGSCNSAVACIYAHFYKMALWCKSILDEILIRGDEQYIKSTQQGDKCLIEVPPEKMHTSFFLGNLKITLFVSPNNKITEELTSASEEKAKQLLENVVQKFLESNESGIIYVKEKYAAVWTKEGVYYFFDPGEHDCYGNPWTGIVGYGVSFLGRFKNLPTLVDSVYTNFPSMKEQYSKVHIMPCGIARIVKINTTPPETFEELAPQEVDFKQIIDEPPPLPDKKSDLLKQYIEEDKVQQDPAQIRNLELSPEVGDDFPGSRLPSLLKDAGVNKQDICRYPVPLPTYLKGEQARLTYYTELVPKIMGILRGSTCQTNPNFSKYLGKQSMGNALSALIMLRLCKAKHWIPKIVDNILKYGETLYRDAMLNIPRTHSLRLSDFSKKIEYEGKYFTPDVDEYAVVGQLQSQEYEILDLEPALEEFLADHNCCVVLGPQILAVWVEDGVFYMFDPNERDQEGKAILNSTAIKISDMTSLEGPRGVACVTWYQDLKELVNLYMNNTDKARKFDRFYLSKIVINDYIPISEDWYNFIGIDIGKWILRGSFNQASLRFSPQSRNTQGTANAFIALAMALLMDEQEWSNDTVDEILSNGDSFYMESVKHLQEKDLFTNPRLMISELNKKHQLRNKVAEFEVEECLINGLVYARDENDVSNLKKGLENFFIDNDYCILTTREISLAIWRKKEAYFYLDPYARNEKGVASGYGTSCVLRSIAIDDLVSSIEANLDPNVEDFFNLTKVTVTLCESGEGGTQKPPLNNYSAINDKSAILRSWLSEQSEKYEIRKGRQTVPMCISAAAFNKLKPSLEWTKNDMDIILDKGDNLYIESMAQAQKDLVANAPEPDEFQNQPLDIQAGGDAPQSGEGEAADQEEEFDKVTEDEEELPEVEIQITSNNVIPMLNIGPNSIVAEFTNIAEGNIKESLKTALASYFEQEQTDENFNQEVLLETKHYTVAMWRDDKVFYIFDPKPRGKNGEVIGKEDWDPEPEPEPEEEPVEEEEDENPEGADMTEGVMRSAKEAKVEEEEEEEEEEEKKEEEEEEEGQEEEEDQDFLPEEVEEEEDVEEEEEEERKPEPAKPKKSPSYWMEQEKSGRACTIWFMYLNDLVDFVYENIPVKDRLNTDFELKEVSLINNLKIKSKFKPGDERLDAYAGNWYDFKELEHGKWILRASLDLEHQLFPESNRGKQGLTTSIIALGIAHIYELTCFVDTVPDSILVYGDKLFTFMKKNRKKQLLNDPNTNLKEDEIDWLMRHEEFTVNDVPTKICISKFMLNVSVVPNVITGDIKAQDFEDILDVKRGLETFFEENKYGVLFAKGLYVAVWRGEKMSYMFDGMKRGPNGVMSTVGSGCLTRYISLEKLADVFLQNLPVLGKNEFFIHKIDLTRDICPREREPKEEVEVPKAVPKTAGLKPVIPGKNIIRGSISQEDPKFGKGPNIMSAPIAVVALTMSLIHKPETWSRPIVDDIVILGSELYEDSVNALGFGFNPWEDKLDIFRIKNDYKLGVIKANCELRNTDQTGYIDVKDSNLQNLRQGIEHFFEENTHGILVTEPITVALWEQKQDEGNPLIYIFDPNPRNSTGMPLFSGSACALSFVNAKMASDHIIGCILEPSLRAGLFTIVPVEIVVGNASTSKKQPEKSPTRSSINILPRCSKLVASENKKKIRKLAEEERKRKEAKKQQMIGRNGYHLKGGEAILRGFKNQNSEYYNPESRNKQDITNCIASVVMHSLLPIEDWNYRHIDLILDTGDQLYIDSYIAYGPKDPKLGMENILRKFFVGSLEVHVTVYKPIITEAFTPSKLNTVLEAFFQQETVCILNYSDQWISIFFKGGFYFMFDPHERDIEGNLIKNNTPGTAVVVRFEILNAMALKIVNNLGGNTNEAETFSLWIMSVQSK